MLTLDIEFPGISQVGLGVNKFAQEILDNINITNADPFMRPGFADGISPDVGAAANGYAAGAQKVGSDAVTRLGA
jgi:hypothetical protein